MLNYGAVTAYLFHQKRRALVPNQPIKEVETRKARAVPFKFRPGPLGMAWKMKLGTMSDRDLASLYSINISTVRNTRKRAGIPAFGEPKEVFDWTKHEHLIGTMSDYALGVKLGVSRDCVRRRRNTLGIKAHRPLRPR